MVLDTYVTTLPKHDKNICSRQPMNRRVGFQGLLVRLPAMAFTILPLRYWLSSESEADLTLWATMGNAAVCAITAACLYAVCHMLAILFGRLLKRHPDVKPDGMTVS